MFDKAVTDAPPEMAKDVRLAVAGERSAVLLHKGSLRWAAHYDDHNTFARTLDLPHGVHPGDVVALHAGAGSVTLLDKRANLHVYTVDVAGGRWAKPTNVLVPPAGAR